MEIQMVCPAPGSDLMEFVIASFWFFPLGAIVFRKTLRDATGMARVFKYALNGAAIASAPFAILTTLPVAFFASIEIIYDLRLLWSQL